VDLVTQILSRVPSQNVIQAGLSVVGPGKNPRKVASNPAISAATVKQFPGVFKPVKVAEALVRNTTDPAVIRFVLESLKEKRISVLSAIENEWCLPEDLAGLVLQRLPRERAASLVFASYGYFVAIHKHTDLIFGGTLLAWLARGGHRKLGDDELFEQLVSCSITASATVLVTRILAERPTLIERLAAQGPRRWLPSVVATAPTGLLQPLCDRIVADPQTDLEALETLVWRPDTPVLVYERARQQLMAQSSKVPPVARHRPLVDVTFNDVFCVDQVLLHCELFGKPPKNLWPKVVSQLVTNEVLWDNLEIRRFVASWTTPEVPYQYRWLDQQTIDKLDALHLDERFSPELRGATRFGTIHPETPEVSELVDEPTRKHVTNNMDTTASNEAAVTGNVLDFDGKIGFKFSKLTRNTLALDRHGDTLNVDDFVGWLLQELGDGNTYGSKSWWETFFTMIDRWDRTFGELIQSVKRITTPTNS